MKKIKLIALLLTSMVVLSTKSSIAQDSTFKLSDYKNPNYFYQSLDLNFRLNSGSDRSTSDHNSDFYMRKSYSVSLNTRAVYSSYANTLKLQSELSGALYGRITNEGSHNTLEINKQEYRQNNFSYNGGFYLYGLKRFYNAKQNYFEINGSISSSFNGNSRTDKNYNSDTISTSSSAKTNSNSNYIDGSFLVGKGRIEQVQDARLALYLLEDMNRLNRDKRTASNEEVLELAKLITSLKYKRFFDNRLRKIAEITAIDSFMQKTGLVSITDAAYFTSLNDNWDFANNPARESGYRIFTGIEGIFSYTGSLNHVELIVPDEITTDKKAKTHYSNLYLVAGIKYENPINLKWQQSTSAIASIGFKNQLNKYENTGTSDTSRYNGINPSIRLNAQYGYGFYPNSRTWLTANWQLFVDYNKQFIGTSKNDKENFQNRFYMYTGPSVNAYYYLSEKLRLTINFNSYYHVNYDKYITNIPDGSDDNQTNTQLNYELEATLTYSLF